MDGQQSEFQIPGLDLFKTGGSTMVKDIEGTVPVKIGTVPEEEWNTQKKGLSLFSRNGVVE